MNSSEKAKLSALWSATLAYYGKSVPDEALELYVEDLSDLSFDQVALALGRYRRDPKSKQAPLPAQIRDLCGFGEPSNQEKARIIAGQIWEAIRKIGSHRQQDAQNLLGPIAWRVVELIGGWQTICFTKIEDQGVFVAQARDLAEVVLKRGVQFSISQINESTQMPLLENVLKTMPVLSSPKGAA